MHDVKWHIFGLGLGVLSKVPVEPIPTECYAMYVWWTKPLAVKSPQQHTHTHAERENKSDTTINNINE